MSVHAHYADHLKQVLHYCDEALTQSATTGFAFDGIVFHAGATAYYHADDHDILFKTVPHFARFVPLAGPEHLLLVRPGVAPRLVQVAPADYWYEPPARIEHPYTELLAPVHAGSRAAAAQQLGNVSRCAYVGNSPETALALGIPQRGIEPQPLLAALDWYRGLKTPYEVDCLREAARVAARGHAAVRRGFEKRLPERTLHTEYLQATGVLERDTPYGNIIGWDEAAATLHYQTKRTTNPKPGHVLLIDAGASHCSYASDITRTYAHDNAHPVFRQLLDGLEDLQQKLVRAVQPKREYIDVHAQAHRGMAELLTRAGILRTTANEAYERGLTRTFLPHGVGHHLGLQVHDVGGHQIDRLGNTRPPAPEHPYLRTTRPLAAGHVVTIEPGLYFIPLLLASQRQSENATLFNWELIDALTPCGGIRIEDDVFVTDDGHENLTRPFVPGHRNGAA